jgi:hypothetical protein
LKQNLNSIFKIDDAKKQLKELTAYKSPPVMLSPTPKIGTARKKISLSLNQRGIHQRDPNSIQTF